jgi:preprotein translocase subunit SecF
MSVRTEASIWHKLYNGETQIGFIRRKRLWFLISGIVILVGLGSLFTRGLNLGIEFEGGVSWQVPVGDSDVDSMRGAVEDAGLDSATVQTVGTGSSERLRIKAEVAEDTDLKAVQEAIADESGVEPDEVTQQTVSKSWGDQITSKARRALIVFLVLVSLYIAIRFEWKMALATLVALVHDILVTVGVYSVFGFEVTPATVIAILTILGYSIYDGIVVFDRVDENAKALAVSGSSTYSDMVNNSLNEVLMRTLNTSITALIPILSLLLLGSLVLGATTLQEFALALFVGLASGAYSSIFIASPSLAVLKEREERWTQLRERLERLDRRTAAQAPVAATVTGAPSPAPAPAPPPGPATGPVIQPRGRKKQGRRK